MATKLMFALLSVPKMFVTNFKTGVRTAERCTIDNADIVTVYSKLDKDLTSVPDNVKSQVKASFLQLASANVATLGKFKYVDESSVYISKNGISVSVLSEPKTVLATGSLDLDI